MGLFGRIRSWLGGPVVAPTPAAPAPAPDQTTPAQAPPASNGGRGHRIGARYDSAKSTTENRNHWTDADGLSANATNSPEVRRVLRNRSRYEASNNSHVAGLLAARAHDTIGCGPRPQVTLPETYTDPDFGRPQTPPVGLMQAVENRWAEWADAVGLADKLLVLDESETRDGEVFAVIFNNPALPADGPQVDFKLIEADRVAAPLASPLDPSNIDGIQFDAAGNPTSYQVLRQHPGDTFRSLGTPAAFDRVPASRVIHWFNPTRPGQARGIPALTPGLSLFNDLRRFGKAVLGAAEVAALFAGVIESDLPADPGTEGTDAPTGEAGDQVEFTRNTLLTLPAGQRAKAFDPSQPAPSFGEFKKLQLSEAGRSVNAPEHVSTGSAASYNFSSAKLDQGGWHRTLKIRRARIVRVVLARLWAAWLAEALLIPDYLPGGLPPVTLWRVQWRWPAWESIDPVKDATANQIKLASGQTTLARVAAESGEDWEEVLAQQAREMRRRQELGLPVPGAIAQAPDRPAPADQPAEPEDAHAD